MSTSSNKQWQLDEIDAMIFEGGLRIEAVYFHKALDIMLILLNNKQLLKRSISSFKRLAEASPDELKQYQISRTGIHWENLDEDISLRGLLKEEMLAAVNMQQAVA